MSVFQGAKQMVGKDYFCASTDSTRRQNGFSRSLNLGQSSGMGSHDPQTLIDYAHAASLQARLSAPNTALKNENERYRLQGKLIYLNSSAPGASFGDYRNPLVVHVLDVDNRAKDVPLLFVRVVNKAHKGEELYITADSINPVNNVTGFADIAAQTHRPGLFDGVKPSDVTNALKVLSK